MHAIFQVDNYSIMYEVYSFAMSKLKTRMHDAKLMDHSRISFMGQLFFPSEGPIVHKR